MKLEVFLSFIAMQGCQAISLGKAIGEDLPVPNGKAQTEVIPEPIVQMYHKAMEHLFPLEDAT